jgi:hypothetical protein
LGEQQLGWLGARKGAAPPRFELHNGVRSWEVTVAKLVELVLAEKEKAAAA